MSAHLIEEKSYQITTICTNCGYQGFKKSQAGNMGVMLFEIPFGTSVYTALNVKKCENCGCKGVIKRKHS